MLKYLIILSSLFFLCSCSICKKMLGRTQMYIEKENMVCACKDLKQDSSLAQMIRTIEKSSQRYLVGKVLVNKDSKGIYQYVKTGTSRARKNMFMYYNGTEVYLLNNDNLNLFEDSLSNSGISMKKIERMIPKVRKSMNMPAVNTTDNF